MNAAALLDQFRDVGITITGEGNTLRVRGRPGVRLTPYTERIREHKPAILAALDLQDRIVAAATVAPEQFSRDEYDRLWREWYALEREP